MSEERKVCAGDATGEVDLEAFNEVNSAFWDGVLEERDWLRKVVSDLVTFAGTVDVIRKGKEVNDLPQENEATLGIPSLSEIMSESFHVVQESDEPTLGNPSVPEPDESADLYHYFIKKAERRRIPESDEPENEGLHLELMATHTECDRLASENESLGLELKATQAERDALLKENAELRGRNHKHLAESQELAIELRRWRSGHSGRFSTLLPDSEGPWIYIDKYGIWRMFVSKRWDGSLLASHSHFHLGKPFLGPVADMPGKWAKES